MKIKEIIRIPIGFLIGRGVIYLHIGGSNDHPASGSDKL